jgi:glycosyltransferase involved in cell wall biosynthesis
VYHSTVVVIPCYNVEKFCQDVVKESSAIATHVILINDGSTDNTAAILKKMAKLDSSRIHIISFAKNRGKGFALLEGMRYALEHLNFHALITIDSDGQHKACFIPELMQPIFDGVDFVIGERPFANMPTRSKFGNQWISFLLKLFYGQAPVDTQSGMRAFSKKLVEQIVKCVIGGRYETEFRCLLCALSNGYKIRSIEIPTIYIDKNKSSHFSPVRDAFRILKVFAQHLLGQV